MGIPSPGSGSSAQAKLNSTNSSQPPSSDPIGRKRQPPAPPSGRNRGGQPGHRKAHRALVPPEKIHEACDCKPTACRRRGHELRGDDPAPLIRQVAELPRIEPIVDEYRLHRLACPNCGATTRGVLPPGVPHGGFGPCPQAVLALFAGAYRLSKRQVQQLASDLSALSLSTGMVSQWERRSSEVLEAPYHELAVSVPRAEDVNSDETSWREDRRTAWPWVAVTKLATVFTIAGTRAGDVAKALLGSKPDQIVTSVRFGASEWIAAFWRRVCWARPRRDFQAMIDRGGDGAAIGRWLLGLSNRRFRSRHRVRDGTPPWEAFPERMRRPRRGVGQALEEGSKCGCGRTAATCFESLKVEEGPWSFARVRGIEPTNNAAERALRFAVIGRRIGGGTDSTAGSRFVERVLSVVATCRQQGRNVLESLTSCFEADCRGQAIPSLVPADQTQINVA